MNNDDPTQPTSDQPMGDQGQGNMPTPAADDSATADDSAQGGSMPAAGDMPADDAGSDNGAPTA